ncbi:MAG: LacI family DNA-binding transcriptional regulator [Lachnospiraceae bacterium]|nr:LacI family DNA-binding transcriptional regulator [Lachnospiraceae bacterium]
MHRVTIKDIAEMAGVSYSSVSRAVNGTGKVSEETKQKILEICEREGYRANTLARNLTQDHTNTIGLIVPSVTNPFYAEIMQQVEIKASEEGYHVLLRPTNNDDSRTESMIEFLLQQQVDGIILATPQANIVELVNKYSRFVPIVMVAEPGRNDDISRVNVVSLNNYEGGRIAADYLYSLGHRDIAYVGFRKGNHSQSHRFQGFTDRLKEEGITPRVIENYGNHSSIESGIRCARQLFESGSVPTAIFSATDFTALGVIKAAGECGIRIPEDLSLLGFDNVIYSSLPKIELSTIDHKNDMLSYAAVDTLIHLIHNPDFSEVVHRTIMPVLVCRSSCIAVK